MKKSITPSVTPYKERLRVLKIETVIAAVYELLASKGFDAMTVDEVAATVTSDFNTGSAVFVNFTAVTPGHRGNEIALTFKKIDFGGASSPSPVRPTARAASSPT